MPGLGRAVLRHLIVAVVISTALTTDACGQPNLPPAAGPSAVATEAQAPGLRVCDVAPDGPAWRAGVKREDHVLAIDGQPLGSFDALAGALRARQPGATITLALRRGSSDVSATVLLGERDGRAYLGLTGCA